MMRLVCQHCLRTLVALYGHALFLPDSLSMILSEFKQDPLPIRWLMGAGGLGV